MYPSTIQQQYLANWHNSFVYFVNQMLTTIAAIELQAQITDADKQGFDALKLLLKGKDVQDVEKDLANGDVRQGTLDKIEKFSKDATNIIFDNLETSPVWKSFWKQLIYMRIAQEKEMAVMRLRALKIPVL